jgi:hypothetical protein
MTGQPEGSGEPMAERAEALRRLAREVAGPQPEADVIYIAHRADGLVLGAAVRPAQPMHGPQLPDMADVRRAQAAEHDTALNGPPDLWFRAAAERHWTETAFDRAAAREVEAFLESEAGE